MLGNFYMCKQLLLLHTGSLSGEDDGHQQSPHLSGPSPEASVGTRGKRAGFPAMAPRRADGGGARCLCLGSSSESLPSTVLSQVWPCSPPASRTNLGMSPKLHGLQNTQTMFAGAWAQPAPKQGDPCFAGNGLSFPQQNYRLGLTPENQEHTVFGFLFR